MTLTGWFGLLGALLVVGALQASWRNALFVKGYDLSAAHQEARRAETDLAWLRAGVIAQASPSALLDAAASRNLSLVAREDLPARSLAAQSDLAQLAHVPMADDE